MVSAIREAFAKARRELVEARAVERGDVKAHEAPTRGRVTELFPEHGFLRAADGRVVYFHRNSVVDRGWESLETGDEVQFRDEPGDEGSHATFVRVPRQRETAG